MQRQFSRNINSLEKVFDFLHGITDEHAVDKDTLSDLDLVVEEIFTNMVKYNALAKEHISISVETSPHHISVCLVDPNSKPFDLTKTQEVNLNMPLRDRKPGGLGIHLVKRLMDSVQYQHRDGKSIVTVTKRLERPNV